MSKKRASTHRSLVRFDARMLPGAKPALFPGFIKPQLATLKEAVPVGDDWLHEIKFDGYRVQGHLIGGKSALITRGGHDWTRKMRTIDAALAEIPANHLIIDGEVIVPDGKGASDFDALEVAMGPRGRSAEMLFYVFDLLHLDGFDLRAAPLIERKRVLKGLLRNVGPPILFSDHMEGDGQKMFEHACAMGLEGVISKRAEAPYRSGRTESWIKVKCLQRGTFTVVGFSPEGSGLVAALYLARKDGRELSFVGKVGAGWTMRQKTCANAPPSQASIIGSVKETTASRTSCRDLDASSSPVSMPAAPRLRPFRSEPLSARQSPGSSWVSAAARTIGGRNMAGD